MIPLFKKLLNSLLYDDLAVRRWLRAGIMTLAASGMAWGDQLSEILGAPVRWIKIAAVIAMAISLAITAGEKNKEVADVGETEKPTPSVG